MTHLRTGHLSSKGWLQSSPEACAHQVMHFCAACILRRPTTLQLLLSFPKNVTDMDAVLQIEKQVMPGL